MNTSTNKYIQDCLLPRMALYANKKYTMECIGLKLFHHIFSPNTSAPVVLVPVKYIKIKPIAGNKAK